MRIFLFLCALLMVVLAATWTYKVNYMTQDALERVRVLQHRIARENEAIAVLETEWAYLNRPSRLRALSEVYFKELRLMPIHAESFGDVGEVAFPRENVEINDLVEQVVVRGN